MTANEDKKTLDPSEGYLAADAVVADRFVIRELLGEGGMGAVYRAEQRGLKREVALKIIRPDRLHRPAARERFLREARVASLLRHPGVVAIHDFGEHAGGLYLAMELLDGPPLRVCVDEHLPLLPWSRVIAVAVAIADVLDAASTVGLVHRDLKPENVILHREPSGAERVVVVDFGLAFVAEGDEEVRRMTREGVLAGTPEYMSPEQCRGSLELGSPSDVYSLGVMLYEMAVGRTPFQGETTLILSRHLFVPVKPLRQSAPEGREVPSALDELVQRMMAKDARDRPTAAQVRERLLGMDHDVAERMSPHAGNASRTGRSARMISRAASQMPPAPIASHSVGLAWVGPPDEALELALAANGIVIVPQDEAAVVFLATPGADPSGHHGLPVIVTAPATDAAALAALLRAGAADVYVPDAGPASLAKKIIRAARRPHRS
ncbi:MAG: serine/threonine protein kinase [Myxococcota bacterium]|nr:serine/threonine protein kinase [Myxococcota bacterium]